MIYEPESFTPLLQLQQPTDTPISEQDKVLAEVMSGLQSTLDYLPAHEAYELSRSVREQTIAQLKASEQWQTPQLPEECYFYHCNHLGLPEALTNQKGEAVWAASYDAWGNVKEEHNPNGLNQPIRLPGQYHDKETDLYYNRHRYYDPKLGSYINQDPIGLAGGMNTSLYPAAPTQLIDPLEFASTAPPSQESCDALKKSVEYEKDNGKLATMIKYNSLNFSKYIIALDAPFQSVVGPVSADWMFRSAGGGLTANPITGTAVYIVAKEVWNSMSLTSPLTNIWGEANANAVPALSAWLYDKEMTLEILFPHRYCVSANKLMQKIYCNECSEVSRISPLRGIYLMYGSCVCKRCKKKLYINKNKRENFLGLLVVWLVVCIGIAAKTSSNMIYIIYPLIVVINYILYWKKGLLMECKKYNCKKS